MSRIKRLRNLNGFITILETITESQCSLSAQDLIILNEAIAKLHILKRKKGLTNKQLQLEVTDIVELIYLFLTKSNMLQATA